MVSWHSPLPFTVLKNSKPSSLLAVHGQNPRRTACRGGVAKVCALCTSNLGVGPGATPERNELLVCTIVISHLRHTSRVQSLLVRFLLK